MPPLKTTVTKKSTVKSTVLGAEDSVAKTMNTRSTKTSYSTLKKENSNLGTFPKRKAVSPIKGNTLKRSALGNITNAIETQCVITSGKKTKKTVSTVTKPTISTTAKLSLAVNTSTKPINIVKPRSPQSNVTKATLPPLPKSRLTLPTRAPTSLGVPVQPKQSVNGRPALKLVKPTEKTAQPPTRHSPTAPKVVTASRCKVTVKPKCVGVSAVPNTRRSSGRRSTLDSTNSSLYVSALSDVSDEESTTQPEPPLPEPEINIDIEYANDPYQCATYAQEIFDYLKSREEHFKIKDYMESQPSLSQHARAILVDWMVEIQENFELNHETLYLAVKLVDTYLSLIKVLRQTLQLVGATAMFIAAKYDERIPPSIDDFLYICDGAYTKKDVTKMEVNMLRVVQFELGFPLSYRFLRRFARCAKVPMPLLTLARFILEYTLMDYSTICLSDSKMAAAALYLAFKMKKEQGWDNTLIHFSGYKRENFIEIVHQLNNILHQKPRQTLSTVRNKYSHKIFYEVAKIPLVSNEDI